jgi:YjbE family integral membrane protein
LCPPLPALRAENAGLKRLPLWQQGSQAMEMFLTAEFWIAVGQIIMIDILLGGDNAVVIALACRRLPPQQRNQGILWGTAGAIVLRIVLIYFALTLLALPFLKIAGALLLMWIGVRLLVPESDEGHSDIDGSDKLWGAVKTVILADLVMSVDNVIAIAGAAEASGTDHGMTLVIFGVLVSIPIIVWGSQLVIRLMDRFPVIITLGGMLLGWIAGTMLVTDPALVDPAVVPQLPKIAVSEFVRYSFGAAGALLVLALGRWLTARKPRRAGPPAATAAVPAPLRRVLLAVDGSEDSLRAARHLLAMRQELRDPAALEVHLLNVQSPVSGSVASFVDTPSLEAYHREHGEAALAPARAHLEAGGVVARVHHRVGTPGPTIAQFAQEQGCDLVVMGALGSGAHPAAWLGSVARSTIEHSDIPVLLVK